MKTPELVFSEIKSEMMYQDSKFNGNDAKSYEVWLLITQQYLADAVERYGHSTQAESKRELLKAVTSGIRALMT